jgi:hypothetical protein
MIEPIHKLYIGDVNEQDLADWLEENISPILFTTKEVSAYFTMYHGDNDLWILDTADVSDVSSSKYDTVSVVTFSRREDLMLCQLTWGGSTK